MGTHLKAKRLWSDGRLSVREIAAVLGIPRSTLYSHMERHREDFPRRNNWGKVRAR